MEIKLGTRTLAPPSIDDLRFSCIIWGPAGCGKTTLAATAPGLKLWVNFDPDGLLSLVGREDIIGLDLSASPHKIVEEFKTEDPFLLSTVLSKQDIQTVVLDSITATTLLATENAVARQATNRNKVSIESPGKSGYSHRNALSLRTFVVLHRMTRKYNKHFIVITHEGSPETDDEGNIVVYPPALSTNLANQLGLQTNEIWYMHENEATKKREIIVRPGRKRKWCKTRMFLTDKGIEFPVKYDAITGIGEGIKEWFMRWKENKGKHIPLPS